MELYVCSHCGNIVTYLEKSQVPVMCCGQKMQKIEPNIPLQYEMTSKNTIRKAVGAAQTTRSTHRFFT
jgi:desulfoferrodoxin-like iron-binding protein